MPGYFASIIHIRPFSFSDFTCPLSSLHLSQNCNFVCKYFSYEPDFQLIKHHVCPPHPRPGIGTSASACHKQFSWNNLRAEYKDVISELTGPATLSESEDPDLSSASEYTPSHPMDPTSAQALIGSWLSRDSRELITLTVSWEQWGKSSATCRFSQVLAGASWFLQAWQQGICNRACTLQDSSYK